MDDTTQPDPLSGTNLCTIRYKAHEVAESAIIAYWMQGRDESCFEHHRKYLIENMRELADAFGFDLVERGTDSLEEAAVDVLLGDHAAQRAREMNAELPSDVAAVLKVKGMIE